MIHEPKWLGSMVHEAGGGGAGGEAREEGSAGAATPGHAVPRAARLERIHLRPHVNPGHVPRVKKAWLLQMP